MKQYKIGNKATAVLRNYINNSIGNIPMEYARQPYTILSEVEADIYFEDNQSTKRNAFNVLDFNERKLSKIVLKEIPLTTRICNLIFTKEQQDGITKIDNIKDTDLYYIPSNAEKVNNLYIFNENQEIIVYQSEAVVNNPIALSSQECYIAIYEEPTITAYALKSENVYMGLDLIFHGNEQDTPIYYTIHLEKASLKISGDI